MNTIKMFSKTEKKLIEEIIELHKENNGTIKSEDLSNVIKANGYTIKSFFESRMIEKIITLDLIRYRFPHISGETTLTKEGMDFTTFAAYERKKRLNKIMKFGIKIIATIIGTLIAYSIMKYIFNWV